MAKVCDMQRHPSTDYLKKIVAYGLESLNHCPLVLRLLSSVLYTIAFNSSTEIYLILTAFTLDINDKYEN